MSSLSPNIKTLTLTKKLLRVISVLPISDNRGGESVYVRWCIAYIMFVLTGTLIPCVAFFVANITDIMKSTESIYLLVAYVLAIAIPLCLLFDRMKIQHILQEIECIVNEREFEFFFLVWKLERFLNSIHSAGYQQNGYNFYAAQDAKIKKYTMRIVLISSLLAFPVIFRPFIGIVIAFFTGNYTTESWQFVFPSMCVQHHSFTCSSVASI